MTFSFTIILPPHVNWHHICDVDSKLSKLNDMNLLKHYFHLLLFALISSSAMAQSDSLISKNNYSKTGGLYHLYFQMSDELTTEYEVSTNKRIFLNSFSQSAIFPDNLLDSVRFLAEQMTSERLEADVSCIYKTSKKGKTITTVGANDELEGMPMNTFKNAVNANHDYYVRLDIQMNAGGRSITLANNKKSTFKPVVTAIIKVYDSNKEVIWKNRVTLKDFSELRSRTKFYSNGVSITRSETLEPEDIYRIYEVIMIELFTKE